MRCLDGGRCPIALSAIRCWVAWTSTDGWRFGLPTQQAYRSWRLHRCDAVLASRSLPGQVDLLGSRTSVIGGRDTHPLCRRTDHGQIPFQNPFQGAPSSRRALLLLQRLDVDAMTAAAFAQTSRTVAAHLREVAVHGGASLCPTGRWRGSRPRTSLRRAACAITDGTHSARLRRRPRTYRALVRKRVSRKAWHPPQVFERGLIGGG